MTKTRRDPALAALIKLAQPCILPGVAPLCRTLTFRIEPGTDVSAALRRLRDGFDVTWGVFGVGEPLARALHRGLVGLRTFPALSGPGCTVPSTQQALWIALQGDDRGELFERSRHLQKLAAPALVLDDSLDTFLYAGGRDLTGYEDGTENPKGDDAAGHALVADGDGLRGGSFVAVQHWTHDLERFERMSAMERDAAMGRSRETNEELADAPPSAHVKRAAQESFDPPAFMLRRSMPWQSAHEQGLAFIAYGASLDRFERVLLRMVGHEDGIVDGLFSFSRPTTGGYYFCPPTAGGKLDLRCLGA